MHDDVHTPENPYCPDLNHWCHLDSGYHETFTHGTFTDPHLSDEPLTDEEIQTAYAMFGIDLSASE